MQPITAVMQLICIFFGYQDKHDQFMSECIRTHTQVECQQLWRDK